MKERTFLNKIISLGFYRCYAPSACRKGDPWVIWLGHEPWIPSHLSQGVSVSLWCWFWFFPLNASLISRGGWLVSVYCAYRDLHFSWMLSFWVWGTNCCLQLSGGGAALHWGALFPSFQPWLGGFPLSASLHGCLKGPSNHCCLALSGGLGVGVTGSPPSFSHVLSTFHHLR